MQFHKKTFKICLLFLCLLAFRPVGLPQIEEATFCMGKLILHSNKWGHFTVLYDDEDEVKISKYKWWAHSADGGRVFYIKTNIPKTTDRRRHQMAMHKLVMCFPKQVVDHIKHYYFDSNRNMLIDNRKSNLRLVTHQQNKMNRRMNRNNKSGFKGVFFSRFHQRYMVYIDVLNERIHLGYVDDPKVGGVMYNEAAKKYHGEFAVLNKL